MVIVKLAKIIILSTFLSACGVQVVGGISIEPSDPTPTTTTNFLSTDLQGTTSTAPRSPSMVLIEHEITKTTTDTFAASSSFQLVSGISASAGETAVP